MQLRRSQLYELAWTVPKEFIAATVGVSGSAVGKTCRKYQIPVPGRGDWQKLRKGQSIHRPPLPEPEKDRVVPVEIEESPESVTSSANSEASGLIRPLDSVVCGVAMSVVGCGAVSGR